MYGGIYTTSDRLLWFQDCVIMNLASLFEITARSGPKSSQHPISALFSTQANLHNGSAVFHILAWAAPSRPVDSGTLAVWWWGKKGFDKHKTPSLSHFGALYIFS